MLLACSLVFLLTPRTSVAISAKDRQNTIHRLKEATDMVQEMADAADRGIPKDLIRKCRCAVIVPGVKKGGFIIAAKYGRGFVTCKKGSRFGAPSGVRVEGGSFGFQIGGSETDVIMLVMSQKGAERLLASKFTLGGDASVAAGPLGRETTAETDATMRAEMLSWSRARGVFAGIALNGATLRPDADAIEDMYGRKLAPKVILMGSIPAPVYARQFLAALNRFLPAPPPTRPRRAKPAKPRLLQLN
jgi:SH3 domain-containing YSC84-like protein 1